MADGLWLGMPLTFPARDTLTRAAETRAFPWSPLPHIAMKCNPEQTRTAFVPRCGELEAVTGSHGQAMAAKPPMFTLVTPQGSSLVTRGDNCRSSGISHLLLSSQCTLSQRPGKKTFWQPSLRSSSGHLGLCKYLGESVPFACFFVGEKLQSAKP